MAGFLPGSVVQAPVAAAVAPASSPARAAAPAGGAVVGIRPALTEGHGFHFLIQLVMCHRGVVRQEYS